MLKGMLQKRIATRRWTAVRAWSSRDWQLVTLLAISVAFLLAYSQAKAFWSDEALTYYTVHNRSLVNLVRFQASTPLVLEPPTQDILLWFAGHAVGYSKLAWRLPSLACFLVAQWLLYRLTRALSGHRAGLIAAAALTGTRFVTYGAEVRPYGFLAMLTVAALFLWFRMRTGTAHSARDTGLLALVIALAATSQFLGALIVYPVVVGELVLCVERRELPDRRVVLALAAGLMAVVLDVPFVRAVAPYKPAAAIDAHLGIASVRSAYMWGFFREPAVLEPFLNPRFYLWSALIAALAGSLPILWQRARAPEERSARAALWAALVALTLYPIPVLLVAAYGTHYFAARYSVQCVLGFVALLAAGLARWTDRLRGRWLVLASVLGITALASEAIWTLLLQKEASRALILPYQTSEPVRALLAEHPGAPLYLTIDECILYPFYGDPAYRQQVRCVYSLRREQEFNHAILSSLTARVLTEKTDLPLAGARYGQMRSQGDVLLVYEPQAWLTWIPQSLARDGAQVTPVGQGLGGTLFRIVFPQSMRGRSSGADPLP
jgi:4-amino-4-deoxy-L-arabinose transferase-like glycosyltransferase